ncbi:hypothetical protein F4678DRAFT_55922 [Xylaria arbuscula]|nr:hypothetical protein F4678DRAFT_55922 [Xylaria arbuscula]
MAQHGAAGWAMGSVGPGMDGGNGGGGDDVGFVGQVDHSTGSYLDGSASHENPYEQIGYAPSASPYGQHSHGHYAPQHQYSNLTFGVEGQPAFSHDIGSMGHAQVTGQPRSNEYQQPNGPYDNGQNLNFRQFHTQEVVGHYPGYAQQQQQVGPNEFQRNSWAEPQPHHSPPNPYAHGQQLYGNNAPLLRAAAASPAQPSQSSTPKPEQNQPPYRVDPASSYQSHAYFQTSQSAENLRTYPSQAPISANLVPGRSNGTPTPSPGSAATPSHPVPWPPQGQAQRLGNVSIASAATRNTPPSVPRPPTTDLSRTVSKLAPLATNPTSSDVPVVVSRIGKPGAGWESVEGCPNLFVGTAPVRRQVVSNTPGVKPHVAGDNRNGTRLLPLLPSPLPSEVLREKVRPLVEELKIVGDSISRAKEQVKAALAGSDEHKKYSDDLKKLESRKSSLESEKKKITGKAGTLKVVKNRSTGKSEEATVYDSESLTDSSDEDDPSELIVQQIMASQTRPTDPDKGVEYDVVRMIRREPNGDQGPVSQAEKEDAWSKVIGQRVADFGKYVVDLCAEAKSLREQKASAPKSQSSQLQAAIDQKYDLVRVALETALQYGDEETLRNMGQHMKLMSGLTIALSRQFANKNYNGDVPKTILFFIAEATLMDLDVFQKVKLSTVLEKHRDNLDDEGKKVAAEISKHAEERTAKNAAEKPAVSNQPRQKPLDSGKGNPAASMPKTASSATKSSNVTSKLQALAGSAVPETARKETKAYSGLVSARKVANGAGKALAGAPPMKRPRDDDADSRATKKLAVESAPNMGRTSSASTSNSAAPPNATASNGQVRPRPSGSTVLTKSRAAPKPIPKRPEPQPSSVSSTISGLLAEIAKPAEKPKPVERPVKAPETPEERTRRLRKESRRGRTVTWKSDEELVQVQYFEHDLTEDEGRASNMIRDARDNRLEGQMLKQMKTQKNKPEGDDEEDDGNPTETELRPWTSPQSFDYSHLDASQREKNYTTCGGVRDINSEQKKVMEEYENRELMSIYTTLSDIPDTPRSPARKNTEAIVAPRQPVLPKNDPKFREHYQRATEWRNFGPNVAYQAALQRLGLAAPPAYLNAGSSNGSTKTRMMTQEERDIRVLSLLNSDRARNYIDPTPYDPTKSVDPPSTNDQRVQEAFSIIHSLVDEMKEKQATDPSIAVRRSQLRGYAHLAETGLPITSLEPYQTQAQAQPQVQQHQQGRPEQLASQVPDQYAAILEQVKALQNSQGAQTAAVSQPAPAQPDNNLTSLLATLGRSSQQEQTATQDPNYAAWQAWAQSQAQAYGAQSQAQSQSHPSYSQQYDNDESTYGSQKQDYQYNGDGNERGGNRKDFNRGAKDHKGINRALIGTKPCTFWAKGQCAKGDGCTFRHDPNDLK